MILFRQAVIWRRRSSEVPGTRPPCTQPAAKYRRHAQLCAGITSLSLNSSQLETTSGGPEAGVLGNEAENDTGE